MLLKVFTPVCIDLGSQFDLDKLAYQPANEIATESNVVYYYLIMLHGY